MRHGRAITFESHSSAPEGPRKLAGGKPGADPGYGPISLRALKGRQKPTGPHNLVGVGAALVAQTSKSAVSPISQSAGDWRNLTCAAIIQPAGLSRIAGRDTGLSRSAGCGARGVAVIRQAGWLLSGAGVLACGLGWRPAAPFTKPKQHAPRRCVNPPPRTAAPHQALGSPASLFPNPNGIPPASPGLSRRRDYPGKRDPLSFQPQRGCGQNDMSGNGHNPVGVGGRWGRLPRVARSSQPWAGGCNPVGVGAGT